MRCESMHVDCVVINGWWHGVEQECMTRRIACTRGAELLQDVTLVAPVALELLFQLGNEVGWLQDQRHILADG